MPRLATALHLRWHRLIGRQVVHLLHIRKTGGTAIRHALGHHRATSGYGLALHDHATTLMDIPQGEYVVLFLRHPVSRFVSGFNSGLRQGRPRFDRPWSSGEAAAFARFTTPNALAVALSSDDPAVRTEAETAMRTIRHVCVPLSHWLDSEPYLRSRLPDLFFIGFQETLAADFSRLASRLKLPDTVRLPSDDVAAHRGPETQDRTLSAAGVANLERWYAADVRLYDLCRTLSARVCAGEDASPIVIDTPEARGQDSPPE